MSLCLLLGAFALSAFYDHTLPHEPDVTTGRVIAQINHGSVVYLTSGEQLALGIVVWSGLAELAVVAVLMSVWRLRQSSVELGPDAQAGRFVEITDYDAIRATYQNETDPKDGPNTSLERTRDR